MEGKAAFMVDQGYIAEKFNQMSCTDFDMGFVVFSKGSKADVDAIIDSCRDKWKKAIDSANKQL